jgi:hypothetical protein
VGTRGTVFSIAVPLPAQAPAVLDPDLQSATEMVSTGVVAAAATAEGGESGVSAGVTGGSAAPSGGSASGGGEQPSSGGGGAAESTVLSELPPGPPIVPTAVGSVAVPTIEPPPNAVGQEDTSLSTEEPIGLPPQGTAPEQGSTSARRPAAAPAGQPETEQRRDALAERKSTAPRDSEGKLERTGETEKVADALFAPSDEPAGAAVALQDRDGELLLAAAMLLARYGPNGERSLTRGGWRRGRI